MPLRSNRPPTPAQIAAQAAETADLAASFVEEARTLLEEANAALLAGFAAISSRISLDAVSAAIGEKFPAKVAAANVAAANVAYAWVLQQMQGAGRAEAG